MKGQQFFDFCRRAATEFSRGFQTTKRRVASRRVASVTPESSVANATQIREQAFPALKRPAKFNSPLRGCKIAVLVFACASACLLVAFAQTEKLPGPAQPIPFSHKLHVGGQNLKCATCHKNPDPGERMGLATAALCMQCHEEVKADSPAIQKLAAFAKDKRDIKWVRVYEIPSFVFFSHRAHLESGATCTECHGEVKELEQMSKVKEMNMASCMNCHQAKGASTDCTYCHEKQN